LGCRRYGSTWWLGVPSGPPNSWEAFVRRCCTFHATLLQIHRRCTRRNQRSRFTPLNCHILTSCLGASLGRPVRSVALAAGPLLQFPAGLRQHGLCSSSSALLTIRFKPCCVPRFAHLKLLFLVSSLLHAVQCKVVFAFPGDACCLPLQARATCSSALGQNRPSCGRGWCGGLLYLVYRPWKS
jgi:hypothetical protein